MPTMISAACFTVWAVMATLLPTYSESLPDEHDHHLAVLAACPTEDSRGPCAWDAAEAGNGDGRSFTVIPTSADTVARIWWDDGTVTHSTDH